MRSQCMTSRSVFKLSLTAIEIMSNDSFSSEIRACVASLYEGQRNAEIGQLVAERDQLVAERDKEAILSQSERYVSELARAVDRDSFLNPRNIIGKFLDICFFY